MVKQMKVRRKSRDAVHRVLQMERKIVVSFVVYARKVLERILNAAQEPPVHATLLAIYSLRWVLSGRQPEVTWVHYLLLRIKVVALASLTWIDRASDFCSEPANAGRCALISCSTSCSGIPINEDRWQSRRYTVHQISRHLSVIDIE